VYEAVGCFVAGGVGLLLAAYYSNLDIPFSQLVIVSASLTMIAVGGLALKQGLSR